MNTPTLETKRLILRKFTKNDIESLFLILKDKEVNTFLPWYPMKNLEQAKKFYEERYTFTYLKPQGYAYAICLKSDNFPIGYIKVDMEEPHDFGYGLRKEFWHQGIVSEAAKAVVEQVKKAMPEEESLYDVAELFKVFGDSTRIRIICALFDHEMCVYDLAACLDMTQSAISHQLRILKANKLVKNRRDGKMMYYSLDDEHVKLIFEAGYSHIMEDK